MSERDDVLAQVTELLGQIAEVKPAEELVRADDLGQANFRGAVPILDQTIELFRELRSSDLTVFPLPILQQLKAQAQVALKTFEDLRTFSLDSQSDVMAARDQLIARVAAEYDQHFQILEPHINYLLVKQTDFAAMETQARAAMIQLDEFTRQKQQEQESIREEMEKTLQTVKAAAAEAGVGQQSIVFGEQAKQDGDSADKWLMWAAVFGIVSVIYVIVTLFVYPPSAGTTSEIVRGFVSRLVVLSLLAYGLGFSVRQYSSSKHNQTVNLHRQNALRTFETFVRATDDQATKDAVLLEATRSIFAGQPTGFLRGGHDSESPNTIIEVVRRMGSGTSGES